LNVFSFFSTYASIDKFEPSGKLESTNTLDLWILAKFQELVNEVIDSLDKYDSYKASRLIIDFVQELSTWYIRRSRRRFWKSENDKDKTFAYETLYYVLTELSKLIAPMTPMYAELLYDYLKKENDPESVHLTSSPNKKEFNTKILSEMSLARKVVEEGLSRRAEAKIKVRQPLLSLMYYGVILSTDLENIIAEEVNVKKVLHSTEKNDKIILLDINISPELKREGLAREIIRNIQSLRKKSAFKVEDRIDVFYQTDSAILSETLGEYSDLVKKEVLANSLVSSKEEVDGSDEFVIENDKLWIGLKR
jgi:isoleucyl-tRNA synthetase